MVDGADTAIEAEESTTAVGEADAAEIRWPGGDDPGWEAWRSFQPSSRWAGKPSAPAPAPGVAYAELGLRAAAFAIDVAVALLISSLADSYLQGFIGLSGLPGDAVGMFTGLLAIAIVAAGAIVVGSTSATSVLRATPGQLAVGLVTLTADGGQAVPFRRALVRQLLLIGPVCLIPVSTTLASLLVAMAVSPDSESTTIATWPYWIWPVVAVLWYLVLALPAIRDPRGRGLHDRLADSVVVREA